MSDILFSPFRLGRMQLSNRVVMAPMTRNRATDNLVNELHVTYYRQRAEAGLVVTEAIAPSPNALGFARIPALYSSAHVRGWRQVTQAVHAEGGHIYAQLMHVGRVAHRLNMPPGSRILAPSGTPAPGTMVTDEAGPQAHPIPAAMTGLDIDHTIHEHALAAGLAMEAGFDGVEIHAANGFLINQFLDPTANQRTDEWGGTATNRGRFAREVVSAVAEKIGPDRVGIRLSPGNSYNGMVSDFADRDELFLLLARACRDAGLAYVHLVDFSSLGLPALPAPVRDAIREAFGRPVILSGGFNRESAEAALTAGVAHLIAFGRPFIANPRLVSRMRQGESLAALDPATLYTAGAEGYTDYP